MIFKVNSMDIPYKFIIKVIIKAIIRMDLFHHKVVKILFNAHKVYVVLRVVLIIFFTIAMILIFSHLIIIIDIVLIVKHYYHYKILNNI